MGIEPDHIHGVGDEIGKGIDIIIQDFAVPVIDDILYSTYVDTALLNDRFHSLDNGLWGRITFDP